MSDPKTSYRQIESKVQKMGSDQEPEHWLQGEAGGVELARASEAEVRQL